MIDKQIRQIIDRPLRHLAGTLKTKGLTANQVSFAGFAIGLAAGLCVMAGFFIAALCFILISRLCDGIDGSLARLSTPTDKGAFLDITLDFLFYSFIPLSFAIHNPEYGLAAAFLIFSFIGTGASFLAYAIIAEKRNIDVDAKRGKGFYYLGGLTEGTETIAILCAFCIWPAYFPILAFIFGSLCLVTTALRIAQAMTDFDVS